MVTSENPQPLRGKTATPVPQPSHASCTHNLPNGWILQFGSWSTFSQSIWRLLKVVTLIGAAFTLVSIWIQAHESGEEVQFVNRQLHEAGELRRVRTACMDGAQDTAMTRVHRVNERPRLGAVRQRWLRPTAMDCLRRVNSNEPRLLTRGAIAEDFLRVPGSPYPLLTLPKCCLSKTSHAQLFALCRQPLSLARLKTICKSRRIPETVLAPTGKARQQIVELGGAETKMVAQANIGATAERKCKSGSAVG